MYVQLFALPTRERAKNNTENDGGLKADGHGLP